jgi:uncharacterized cupredoxin-like copper-binding protein
MRCVVKRTTTVLAVIALMLAGLSCGGGGDKVAKVDVTLSDFKIELSKTALKNGKVEFQVKNNGPTVHEFVILDTDLAADQLPLKGTEIDEGQLKVVDELEDLAKDSNTTLKVTLDRGKYVLICNVAGHYQSGMRLGLNVD